MSSLLCWQRELVLIDVAFLWIFIGMLMIMTYRLFVQPPQVGVRSYQIRSLLALVCRAD